MNRRSFLLCAAAAATIQSPLVAGAAREAWYYCEWCTVPLFEGDEAFLYDDGPAFCREHAPTWLDLNAEQCELIEAGEFGGLFEDDERAWSARRRVLDQIFAGNGSRPVLYRI